jgi:NADPH-dependent 2,4-dienoyl-CoA reductase/sulfur reductase-like enzyme
MAMAKRRAEGLREKSAKRGVRRRHILQGALAAACAAQWARAAFQPGAVETVIVLGAGLAGLASAYRLRETGRRVVVLEARPAPGGRVRTARMPFDDGLYGELGAARIADTHHYVLHWLNQMGLSVVPFAPSEGATLFGGAGAPCTGLARRRA